MNPEVFWCVMRDKGESYVSKRHPCFESAKMEAQRLCRKEGGRFYVLQLVGYVQPSPTPIEWVDLTMDPGYPHD